MPALLAALAVASVQNQDRLSDRVSALLSHLAHGRIGVAFKDLKSGASFGGNFDERFPMQSVFKLPLAIAVLHEVESGHLNLEREVLVTKNDLSVPYSGINEAFKGPTRYSIRQLIDAAVSHSDNTAADLLMKLAGGPKRVTEILANLGIRGIRVDRYERQLQSEALGLGPFRPEWSDQRVLDKAIAKLSKHTTEQAMARYLQDPRDTATPHGMLDLLIDLKNGRLLKKAHTALLLGVMTSANTGADRLRAGFPKGTVLAHKTGTGRAMNGIAGAINDVGLAELPDGRNFAIVVFLAGSSGTTATREKLIADVARAVTEIERAPARS